MKQVCTMWHVVLRRGDVETFAFLFKAVREGVLDAVFKHVGEDGKDPHYHCLLRFDRRIDIRAYCPFGCSAEPCHSREAFISYGANEREAST